MLQEFRTALQGSQGLCWDHLPQAESAPLCSLESGSTGPRLVGPSYSMASEATETLLPPPLALSCLS